MTMSTTVRAVSAGVGQLDELLPALGAPTGAATARQRWNAGIDGQRLAGRAWHRCCECIVDGDLQGANRRGPDPLNLPGRDDLMCGPER